ncbi:MAG TPA: ABC transporter substrate-binding protein [Mycobacteriales bacterium]|nr:ABC transporter substrate-binding protein [Mycobacteriales bacterium]
MPRRRLLVPLVAAVLAAAACSSGAAPVSGASASATASGAASLAGVCPDTVTIQSNWWAQAEDGAIYRLLGGTLDVDEQHKRVTGALVADGVDTGVKLQIRSGGPANGFVPAASVLYTDPSVLLATADTDQVAQLAGTKPVKAVVAPLDRSPVVLMYDPAQHSYTSIADIGKAGTRVLYFQGATYIEYLVGSGRLTRSQVDSGYQGTPDRWVSSRGSIVQQGFLTNEPFAYEKELPAWDKKVAWLLVADAGYPVYPETLTVRADKEAADAACLRKLVPLIQRSAAGYLSDPAATNALIVKLTQDYDAYPYSAARAAYAAKVMKDNAIVGNGSNATLGDFDTTRVTRLLDIVRPVYAAQKTPLPTGLTAADIVTNAYIDPSIGAG